MIGSSIVRRLLWDALGEPITTRPLLHSRTILFSKPVEILILCIENAIMNHTRDDDSWEIAAQAALNTHRRAMSAVRQRVTTGTGKVDIRRSNTGSGQTRNVELASLFFVSDFTHQFFYRCPKSFHQTKWQRDARGCRFPVRNSIMSASVCQQMPRACHRISVLIVAPSLRPLKSLSTNRCRLPWLECPASNSFWIGVLRNLLLCFSLHRRFP